jgi:predicted small metal-binding protein
MDASETQRDTLIVRCDCGFEVRGDTDEVVEAMQAHARDVHNMNATREQVLARAHKA